MRSIVNHLNKTDPDSAAAESGSKKIRAVGTSCTEPESAALDCNQDFLELLSTHFLICNDKIKGDGEDSGFVG